MNVFINRKDELKSLQRDFDCAGGSLYILYGRRRLGKTTLLRKFTENIPSVYHMADRGTEKDAIGLLAQLLAQSMAEALGETTLATSSFDDYASEYGVVKVGRCWDRHHEIDVAGIDESGSLVLVGECKMTKSPAGISVLKELHDKVAHFAPSADNLRLVIFSSGGYTDALRREAKLDGVKLHAEPLIFTNGEGAP